MASLLAGMVVAITWTGVAYAATPHSGFTTSTELCASCHVPHQAMKGTKIMRSEETILCLTCHDGRGSSMNVADDFSAGTDSRSMHDVTDQAQAESGGKTACDSCHNPHEAVASARYVDPDHRRESMANPVQSVVSSEGMVWVLIGSEHDAVPPVVSGVTLAAATATPASPYVTWTTDEAASSWIDWGTTTSYELGNASSGSPFGTGAFTSSHSVTMTGLTIGTTYHYRVRSADALGNVTLGPDRTVKPTTPPATPTLAAIADVVGTGWGPANATVTCSTVTSTDGHAVHYEFEFIGGGSSGWLSAASWSPAVYDGAYSIRVRARDAVDTQAVSAWSTANSFNVSNAAYPEPGPAFTAPQSLYIPPSDVKPSDTGSTVATEVTAPAGSYSIDTDLLVLRTKGASGFVTTTTIDAAWQSQTTEAGKPVPTTPGAPLGSGAIAAADSVDGSYLRTALASADRRWDWQLARFDLGSSASTTTAEISVVWRGHGVPTSGYNTALYVWDLSTGSWRETTVATIGTDRTLGWTTQSVANEFCLRCHDGVTPTGTVMPAGVTNISSNWGAAADRHGSGVGVGFAGALRAPYTRGQGAVACTACHETHGSASVYHFPSNVNGNMVPTITGGQVATLCGSCHDGGLGQWHQPCYSCHAEPHTGAPDITDRLPTLSSNCLACHGHGKSWTHTDGCLACHGPVELQALGASHAPWTYAHTF